jgi:transcriptional regulator GlxA family with amidase domain
MLEITVSETNTGVVVNFRIIERTIVSIITGAFVLARAGLLDWKRATTHWEFARELAIRFPKINVDSDPI